MTRTLLALALLATPVIAAERSVAVTAFDRIRVDGPFEVRVTTRGTPLADIHGNAGTLDGVVLRVEGGTLIVRPADGRRPAAGALPVVRAQTRELRSAGVSNGGRLTVSGPFAAPRVALTVTGRGEITASDLRSDELAVTAIGDVRLALGGTARTARLLGNGGGEIAAAGLVVNDLTVRTEGPVAVTVTARYTATANSSGNGPINILGKPDCKVKAQGTGVIRCFNAPVK